MKFYVASKFENVERVREVMRTLEIHGHTLTCDWTESTEDSIVGAEKDIHGVQRADFLVGVFETPLKYVGSLMEVGMAIGMGIPIVILGSQLDGSIFMHLPFVFRVNDILGLKAVVASLELARRNAQPVKR